MFNTQPKGCRGVPSAQLGTCGMGQQAHLRPSGSCARAPRRVALAAQGDDSVDILWQQRRQLEFMLRMSDPTAEEDASEAAPQPPDTVGTIRDLPLWRIQTAVLPGAQVRSSKKP
jgi:hypothetical protein